jgi:hypothetical protein
MELLGALIVLTPLAMLTRGKRHGGIWFFRCGKLRLSFCISHKREESR